MMKNEAKNRMDAPWEIDLPKGHAERFLDKLDRKLHHSGERKLIRFQSFTIAASVAVLVVSSLIMILRVNQFQTPPVLLSEVSVELMETELYFQQSIRSQIDQLKEKNLLTADVKEDIEEIDHTLENVNRDLRQNPGDDRVIETILMIYQTKLELINQILRQSHS